MKIICMLYGFVMKLLQQNKVYKLGEDELHIPCVVALQLAESLAHEFKDVLYTPEKLHIESHSLPMINIYYHILHKW